MAAETTCPFKEQQYGLGTHQTKKGTSVTIRLATEADVAAGGEFGAALANEDVAGDDGLSAKLLHAETLAFTVATVAGAALSFLMCHDLCANLVDLEY